MMDTVLYFQTLDGSTQQRPWASTEYPPEHIAMPLGTGIIKDGTLMFATRRFDRLQVFDYGGRFPYRAAYYLEGLNGTTTIGEKK